MPFSNPDPQRGTGAHGYLIWRALILLGLVLAAITLYLSTRLFVRADESIDANRTTLCKVGAFLTGTPLIQQAGISDEVFIEQLLKVRSFLRGLRMIDCVGLGPGAEAVTPEAVTKQLDAIREAIRERGGNPRGGGGSTGSGPASPPGGGSQAATPAPSTTPQPARPPRPSRSARPSRPRRHRNPRPDCTVEVHRLACLRLHLGPPFP